ncbi:putative Cysteine protease protein [Naja naja]|nr:putative Cysteine protease protein [Naja naja]
MVAAVTRKEDGVWCFRTRITVDYLEDLPETDEPAWILGRQHHLKTEKSKLLSDIGSRLWFTYRRKFSPIDWQWEEYKKQPEEYKKILCCFLDRKDCCYSIHQMAVYVSMDNTVVIEDIKKMCWAPPQGCPRSHCSSLSYRSSVNPAKTSGAPGGSWKPLLLIVPLRLGINHINPVYVDAFKECFKMPQSLGALGGKPNNAYYFIGFLGNELIYLDPHTTQVFVDSDESGAVDDHSFHCQQAPHRMQIMNLDPSVALVSIVMGDSFVKKKRTLITGVALCKRQEIHKKQSLRMFELVQKHPPHWPPFIPPTKPEVTTTGAELIDSTDKLFEMEEEFEILSV